MIRSGDSLFRPSRSSLPRKDMWPVAVVASNAALPSELYWRNTFPNTPIPKPLQDLLLPGKISKPAHIGVQPNSIPQYRIYASDEQLRDKDYSYFFLQNQIHPGSILNLHFTKTTVGTTFLPRQVANSYPFSSANLPQILDRFGLNPQSKQAKVVQETIRDCEAPAADGEERFCATSLESMVDYSIEKLGNNAKVLATEVDHNKKNKGIDGELPKQEYRVEGGMMKRVFGDKSMVCHNQNYAYAVFYCHLTTKTTAYVVPLVGADGTRVMAAAVCHSDTSKWNPKHLAFQALNVKPGTVPVCHFLPEDHIVWVSNN
ncbi:hypothetical protein Sjap_011377 [Stephania japonica]|uniref:BURP domain-containing protein n=1 Tax=Stephania japonica TaxID=461633 RepID=A0AAP0JDA0_9MAGN